MNSLSKHKKQQLALKNVLRACQHLLVGSEQAQQARQYLNSRLGLKDQLMWEFGYFPTDHYLSELTNLVSKADLEFLNLYYPKFLAGGIAPHGHFSDHNLIMPFRDVHGNIVSLLGRSLLSEEDHQESLLHKYKYSSGCQKDLYVYGLDKAKDAIIAEDCVIGVEGQFDCIALHTHGIHNAVAFGWANLSRYQMFQLHRYTNNIILMYDNDEAGQKAKKRVREKYKNVANIKLVSPPKQFKDIDEFFRQSKDKEYVRFVIDTIKGFWRNDE
jgi:DNA primase catalytic core